MAHYLEIFEVETKTFKESKSETKLLVIYLCVVVTLSEGGLVGSRPYSITERHWTNPSWGRTSDWTKFRLRGCLSETVGGDRRVERKKNEHLKNNKQWAGLQGQ